MDIYLAEDELVNVRAGLRHAVPHVGVARQVKVLHEDGGLGELRRLAARRHHLRQHDLLVRHHRLRSLLTTDE
jgi:hypothetical protein